MIRRFPFIVLGVMLLFSMTAMAYGADKKKQHVPGGDNASRLVGTRSSDGDRTTVRDTAGRTTGSATTNGNHTTLRDSSGRAIGFATRNGNNVTFRDSAGRTTGIATIKGDRTTYRDSSGRTTGSSSESGNHTQFRDSAGRSTGSATESARANRISRQQRQDHRNRQYDGPQDKQWRPNEEVVASPDHFRVAGVFRIRMRDCLTLLTAVLVY